ncbi:MAG: ABC transporter substrate-binding protein [bacterium]|nr:MAG: ABC transporter substrate-binding protein [bacterium]
MKRKLMTALVSLMVAHSLTSPGDCLAGGKISFGVLPVMQALPLFVAQEKGFFRDEQLDVELVPFNSGLEKDAAMAAGRTQGYFGDMLTSIILGANQVPMRMVATVFNTTGDQRMFAVLAAPGTGKPSLTDLAQQGIAGSSNTIIEFVTVKLLQREAPGASLNMLEAKNIMTRLPMLLEGQVPAAVLPEPLVTLAEAKGALVVADDRGLGITPTTLLFTREYIDGNTETVRAFLRAVTRASALINADPESVRPIMIKYARIPEPLQQSMAIPAFAPPSVPDEGLVSEVYTWLRGRGILKKELAPDDMVRRDLLP